MNVRPADLGDSPQIAEIYNHYIATWHATFEIDAIDDAEMLGRMSEGMRVGYPFFVAENNGEIIGYAYGHQFRKRHAYRHSVEVSVYIKPGHEGRNIGTTLYENLFAEIKRSDFHVIIAGISLPNDASVRLMKNLALRRSPIFAKSDASSINGSMSVIGN